MVQLTACCNKYSFFNIRELALFVSKQTFARIVFLRHDGQLLNGKGTHNVKFLT